MATPALPGATAGRRRFWVTVLVFALANAAAWVVYHRLILPARFDLLRVENFVPGDNAVVAVQAAMQWRFNLDVAPTAPDLPPGSVTPAVNGRWQWRDARTLSFIADEGLPQATRLTFTLAPQRLRTAEGFFLSKPHTVTVTTSPLAVLAVRQAGFEDSDRYVLELEFNDRVLPADATAKLTLTGPDGKRIDFTPHGQAVGNVIRVLTDSIAPPADGRETPVRVKVAEGLAGVSGPVGLARAYEQTVTLGQTLAVTDISGRTPAQGKPVIRLTTNGRIELSAVKQVLSVEPAVPYELSWDDSGVSLHGEFAPQTRYAVKIAAAPKGADRGKYPRSDTLSVLMPQRESGLWFEHAEGYLGAAGNRTLLARAVGLQRIRASAWRVYDSNLVAWRNAPNHYGWGDSTAYSQPLATRTISLAGPKEKVQDVRLALDDLLPADAPHDGVYRVSLKAVRKGGDEEEVVGRGHATAVATLSDIGLTAKRSRDAVTVWAVSLSTAEPIPGVRLRIYSTKNQLLGEGRTDGNGLATINEIAPNDGEEPSVILADRPAAAPATSPTTVPATQPSPLGLTWLDLRTGEWKLGDTDVAGREYVREGLEAFVYTDRGIYRPGETVHLRAVVRNADHSTPKPFPVRWQLRRPDLRDWRGQTVTLDADGGAELSVRLPEDVRTGRWSAHLGIPGSAEFFGSVSFQVEEFMPQRMKVSAVIGEQPSGAADGRLRLRDRPIAVRAQADYLFGRPASGLTADLTARLDPAAFSPAPWSGWTFGDAGKVVDSPGHSFSGLVTATPAAPTLDESGAARWSIDLQRALRLNRNESPSTRPTAPAVYKGPWKLSVSAAVKEAGGRAVVASDSATIDVLPWYIGARLSTAGALRPGVSSEVQITLVQPDGAAATNDAELTVTLLRETWSNTVIFRNGRYHYDSHRMLEAATSDVPGMVGITGGRGVLRVAPPDSGAYILCLYDPESQAFTSIRLHASDGSSWDDNISRENPERLELTVLPAGGEGKAADAFRVGETAQVLVRSPFAGRLLLTVETDQVISTKVIDMPASSAAVPVEISEALRPNAYVTASVVRRIEPDKKWRTHRAFGAVRLSLDPADRKLSVAITAPPEVRPSSPLGVQVAVTGPDGKPARGAAVTLAAVDEGILQLTGFNPPDPLGFFHAKRGLGVGSLDLYGHLMPEVPRPDGTSSVGGDGDDGSRHRSPISARRVKSVALISPVLHTDEHGQASVRLDIPEFAGRLRLMVVAHSGPHFGSSEAATLVRSPLLIQSSLPRFAAPGDRFTAPLVVFNNSNAAREVSVSVELPEAANPLLFVEATRDRKLTLPPLNLAAGEQRKLEVPLQVAATTGVARVRITAAMGEERFEENIELPVRPAAPTITRGGFASATPAAAAVLQIPRDLMAGTERLEIRATPWPTLQLPEGLEYLERYPYGCAEQTISGCFPLVYLSDIGRQIAPGVFEKQRVAEKLQAGITRIMGLQAPDGGLAMWPGHGQSWPWASVYAAHLLIEAERAGHDVPDDFRRSLLSYCRRLLDDLSDDERLETQAYAAYVLSLADRPERAIMSRLTELASASGASALPRYAPQRAQAKLYLALAWHAAGRHDLAAGLIPQALPMPRASRELAGNLGSPVRDRAVLLSTLLTVQPEHPALPALAQQLADSGRGGHWRSTQDCAFAVMALGRYIRQAKSRTPYEAVTLRGGGGALASADAGMSLAWTAQGPATRPGDYRVEASGVDGASAHVSWLLTGVPVAPPGDADHGIKIRRRYMDEKGKPIENNRLASGDAVLVELSLEAPAGQENLVIEDLLPAGLEVENPRLQSAATSADTRAQDGEPAFIPQRVEMRDDRIVLMGAMPQASRVTYRYLARAVAPGTFVVPPVRAECMYDIAVNSLSGGGTKLIVEPQSTGKR